jgi:hypothetical protein
MTMRTLGLLVGIAVAFGAFAQPTRWTAEEWREDLAYLHERIQTTHKNPYHTTTKEALDSAVADLDARIPELTDFEISFGMQRIVASLRDGHSRLAYGLNDLATFFPILTWVFDDGLYITEARDDADRVAGARIDSIEGRPVDEIRDALEPYMNRDNDMSILNHFPFMIRVPQVLHAIGVSEDPARAVYQLVDVNGETFERTFEGVPYDAFDAWASSIEPPADAPLYRQRNDEPFWFTTLEEHGAVYMQFSSVRHREDQYLSQFAEELLGYIDENELECLIIDVRMNGGGNGMIVNHFIREISKHEVINQPGHLYVITGRETFSAALMFTVRMERRTNALFAGEPGAGKPNSYSETGPYKLPNSGLEGSLSALFHQESDPEDVRPWVDVDIPAKITYADYAANRDPFLDAVLAHWEEVRAGE